MGEMDCQPFQAYVNIGFVLPMQRLYRIHDPPVAASSRDIAHFGGCRTRIWWMISLAIDRLKPEELHQWGMGVVKGLRASFHIMELTSFRHVKD